MHTKKLGLREGFRVAFEVRRVQCAEMVLAYPPAFARDGDPKGPGRKRTSR